MFNVSDKIESFKSSIIGVVLVLACTILGLIWISIGVYSFFVAKLDPVRGPLLLGALLFLPIVVYGLVKLFTNQDKRSKQQRMFDEAFAGSSVGSISRMIETMSGHSPLLAAVVAVLGGFLASRFPQFLAMFAELVSAFGDELTRRNIRRNEEKVRKAEDDERRGTPPPPPDVEPTAKRRGKKVADY